jgi:hypothetical protein
MVIGAEFLAKFTTNQQSVRAANCHLVFASFLGDWQGIDCNTSDFADFGPFYLSKDPQVGLVCQGTRPGVSAF